MDERVAPYLGLRVVLFVWLRRILKVTAYHFWLYLNIHKLFSIVDSEGQPTISGKTIMSLQ